MIVTLDGRKLDPAPADIPTLQAALDAVRDTHLADRIIVSVQVDGRPLIGGDLEAQLDQPLSDVSQIDLESAPPRDVALAALAEVSEELRAAAEAHGEIVEALRKDQFAEACRGFSAMLNVWRTSQQTVLECCSLLGIALEELPIGEQNLAAYLAELIARLQELRCAFEARDTVLLGDLVQYELPEITAGWRTLIDSLRTAMSAKEHAPTAS